MIFKKIVRKLCSAGYQPSVEPAIDSDIYFHKNGLHGKLKRGEQWLNKEVDFTLIFPSVFERCSLDDQLAAIEDLSQRILEISPNYRIEFVVSMQCKLENVAEATQNRDEIFASMPESPRVSNCIIISPFKGKIKAINVVLEAVKPGDRKGILWVDDDIRLNENALERLISKFVGLGCKGAVGAKKIPLAKSMKSSEALHYVKNVMKTSSTAYPHGCCILVEYGKIKDGIPERYICDDGYICFTFLRPKDENPMKYLNICQEALCYHTVGGTWKEQYFRIRRSFLSLMIYCLDFTDGEALFYLRNMQFYGLWPLSKFDNANGIKLGLQKYLFKLVAFIWFSEIYLEMVVRGILKRPLLKINWAAYTWTDENTIVSQNTGSKEIN